MRRIWISALCVGLLTTAVSAQKIKYGVSATSDKTANFAAFKTYTWSPGWPAADKAVHQQIVALIDQQMAALGLEKRESGAADVVVLYAAVRRTDVDLDSKMDQTTKRLREYPAGTLAIILRDPATAKELFHGRADKVLDTDPAKLNAILDATVKEIFAKYPVKSKKTT